MALEKGDKVTVLSLRRGELVESGMLGEETRGRPSKVSPLDA